VVLLGEAPPGLGQGVLAGLPRLFEGGEAITVPLDVSHCYDRQRAQFNATCVLTLVPLPPPGWVTIALTPEDLFLPALSYVFGLSPLGERRAIVSWNRLKPPGRMRDEAWKTLIRRTTVEIVHELGHALGLVHCPVNDCAMHRSLFAEAVDFKRAEYCPACLDTLLAQLTEP
jgi:archaemetzincin